MHRSPEALENRVKFGVRRIKVGRLDIWAELLVGTPKPRRAPFLCCTKYSDSLGKIPLPSPSFLPLAPVWGFFERSSRSREGCASFSQACRQQHLFPGDLGALRNPLPLGEAGVLLLYRRGNPRARRCPAPSCRASREKSRQQTPRKLLLGLKAGKGLESWWGWVGKRQKKLQLVSHSKPELSTRKKMPRWAGFCACW